MTLLPSNDRIVHAEARRFTTGAYPLRSLIATILDQHHAYLKNELISLEALVTATGFSGPDNCRATAINLLPLFVRLRKELHAHMKREEVILFPLIEQLESAIAEGRPVPRNSFGPLSNAIQFMNEDHGLGNKLLAMMAGMTDGFTSPPGGSERYRSVMERLKRLELDLAEHVRKEDEILFPETIRLEARVHLDE